MAMPFSESAPSSAWIASLRVSGEAVMMVTGVAAREAERSTVRPVISEYSSKI